MVALVWTADPDEQPDSGHGLPGSNRQERKVHLIGPLASKGGPCREHGAQGTDVVQGARQIPAVRGPLNPAGTDRKRECSFLQTSDG